MGGATHTSPQPHSLSKVMQLGNGSMALFPASPVVTMWLSVQCIFTELGRMPLIEAWLYPEKKFSLIPALKELMTQLGERDHFLLKILLMPL